MTRWFKNISYFVTMGLFAWVMYISMFSQASDNLGFEYGYDITKYRIAMISLCFSLFIVKAASANSIISDKLYNSLLIYCVISSVLMILSPAGSFSNAIFNVIRFCLIPYIVFGVFYGFSFNVEQNLIDIGIIIMLIIFAVAYFEILQIMLISTSRTSVFVAAYLVCLLPLALLINNNYVKIAMIGIILVVVFTNTKRTALIATVLSIVSFLFLKTKIDSKGKVKHFVLAILSVVAIGAIFNYFDALNDNILSQRLADIGDDGGNGRSDIWRSIFVKIRMSPFFDFVFGHGYMSTVNDVGISAHNDFLEVLYDYGLIGFIPYLLLHYTLLKKSLLLIRNKSLYGCSMMSSYVIFFVFSMTSHVIIYMTFSLFTMVWGYILGKANLNLNN